MSTPIGEHDVCAHMDTRDQPAGYRRMDTISMARRIHFRHLLEGIKHQAGDLRNAMVGDDLNADGAMIDLERMINGLMAVRKGLADPHEKSAKVMNGNVAAGDHIAYTTRSGSQSYMSIGEVLAVVEKRADWGIDMRPALKVKVTQSTHYGDVPRVVVIGVLDRVVKL